MVLTLRDIKYAYHDDQALILDIPFWAFEKGSSVFLHGESGSGKSTLLNLLSGMLEAKEGQINIAGAHLHELSARQRDRFRAEHVGVVFQQFNLIPYLSVMDNVLLAASFASGYSSGLKSSGLSSSDIVNKAKDLFSHVNLPESIYKQKAMTLSIGQQQRVAIVRALLNSPEILLVDEPTSALDTNNRDAFIRLLLNVVAKEHASLIFVSHDLSLASYFDEVLELSNINLARSHSADSLLNSTDAFLNSTDASMLGGHHD